MNQINVGRVRGAIPFFCPLQCQEIPVPALHAHRSFADPRGCSGTLGTPGSLTEDLFEVRIIQGLFPACLVQSLLLNNKGLERYSAVLQLTLLRERLTLSIQKITLQLRYVPPIHCNLP